MSVSLRNLIDAAKRLDELGIARVIANAAELVHKQQKGGQPLHTITPEAIVVSGDGEVTLSLAESNAAYTSPERLRGEAGDRRSDVFALGAVLWEALAHERLFDGEIEGEIKAAVLECEYRSVSETNANVPSELDAICKKALSRTATDRYPSCKVMAAEIATVLDDAEYPDDNTQIADYIANKYVAAPPKPIHVPTSKATPLPGALEALRGIVESAARDNMRDTLQDVPKDIVVSLADKPATQTLQGVAPKKELEAALEAAKRAAAGTTDSPIELTNKIEPVELVKKLEPKAEDPAKPGLAKADPAKTLLPTEAIKPPAVEPQRTKPPTKPPEQVPIPEPRAKTPSAGGGLPSWATARPAEASTPPPTQPASTMMGLPSILNTPPSGAPTQEAKPDPKSFSKTAVLGSLSSADLALPPVEASEPVTSSPAIPIGRKTEPHGSVAERLAAINRATPQPGTIPPPIAGLPAMPPGANITTAETVATPQLANYAAAEQKAATALDAVKDTVRAPEPITLPPSEARQMVAAMPAAATGTAVASESNEAIPHPASVVALPRARSKSEGGRARTDSTGVTRDPLAGWGWGTDSHAAITDDDDIYEQQKTTKRRLVMAIGGAAAVLIVVVVAAFAFGGSDEKKKTDVSAKQADPTVDWKSDPVPPPDPNAGSAVDPNAGSGSAVDPNAGSAALIDPNVGSGSAVDPNAGSGSAVTPPAPTPEELAQAEAAKAEAAKTEAAAAEAAKIEAAKIEAAKIEADKQAKIEADKLAKLDAAARIEAEKQAKIEADKQAKADAAKKVEADKQAKAEAAKAKAEADKQAKADAAKTVAAKAEAAKTAKAEAAKKAEAARIAAAKKEPKKLDPPKGDPKNSSWDPLKPKVTPVEAKKPPAKDPKPVDPYAEKKPTVDAGVALKTGTQQFARGDSNGALATFKASLASNPDYAPTWRGIGMVYEKLGKKSQAKTAFRRYLQLSPSAGDAELIRERMEKL